MLTHNYETHPPAVRHPLPPMYPGGMRLDEEEEQAVLEVIRSKRLFRYYGPYPGPSQVEAFEQEFSRHLGVKYAVGVTSGTAALICGLAALGVGPGDEVIVPAYTWIATASAVVAVGAVPVLAEVDESLTLDPADLERVISPYTKAIIPVHMRGAPCQMQAILEVARKHNLKVLEDAAQANGASFAGRRLGAWGDAGAFSLQFNKIITSGEGGAVITDQEEVWERVQMFHDVVGGQRNKIPDSEVLPGINFRMPELLGAVARVQLRRLETLLETMRRNKRLLKESMAETARRKGVAFRRLNDSEGEAAIALVLFAPEAQAARRIASALETEGGEAWILYSPENVDYHVYPHWSPILRQRTWSPGGGPWRNHPRVVEYTQEMCPRTLDLLSRAVHIDVSPELSSENLEELADALNKALEAV
jgi:dTDP-4-amino-4,6-dideoxygalactose transaminase